MILLTQPRSAAINIPQHQFSTILIIYLDYPAYMIQIKTYFLQFYLIDHMLSLLFLVIGTVITSLLRGWAEFTGMLGCIYKTQRKPQWRNSKITKKMQLQSHLK